MVIDMPTKESKLNYMKCLLQSEYKQEMLNKITEDLDTVLKINTVFLIKLETMINENPVLSNQNCPDGKYFLAPYYICNAMFYAKKETLIEQLNASLDLNMHSVILKILSDLEELKTTIGINTHESVSLMYENHYEIKFKASDLENLEYS